MKRILVIDDEIWLREMVHMALEQKGYEVLEAENGAAGDAEITRRDAQRRYTVLCGRPRVECPIAQ